MLWQLKKNKTFESHLGSLAGDNITLITIMPVNCRESIDPFQPVSSAVFFITIIISGD